MTEKSNALVEGWWAAVVVARPGDKVTLRWRDYPGWPGEPRLSSSSFMEDLQVKGDGLRV